MLLLLIALVATPILELYLLIEIGSVIGAPWTILAVLATAMIGAVLIRRQGMGVLREAQASMNRQELPLKQLFDGFFLLIAGAMLLTPGFFTDTIGFILLVPLVNVVMLYVFAFADWPVLQRARSGPPGPGPGTG